MITKWFPLTICGFCQKNIIVKLKEKKWENDLNLLRGSNQCFKTFSGTPSGYFAKKNGYPKSIIHGHQRNLCFSIYTQKVFNIKLQRKKLAYNIVVSFKNIQIQWRKMAKLWTYRGQEDCRTQTLVEREISQRTWSSSAIFNTKIFSFV